MPEGSEGSEDHDLRLARQGHARAPAARRVVLHEFGHALGCIHEHQNPEGGINWNLEAVYAFYAGPPNNWSQEETYRNIIQTYDESILHHTPMDGKSIMMYPVDPRLTTDHVGIELQL